jgi:hypothetical protein
MAGSVSKSTEATEVSQRPFCYSTAAVTSRCKIRKRVCWRMAIATENVAPRVMLALNRLLRYSKKREARPEDSCACLGTT